MGKHIQTGEVEQELTGFYLAAHSFGGYIMGNYALKYTQHIKRVILISPIGVKPVFPGEPPLHPYKRFEGKVNAPPRGSAFLGRYLWNKRMSPLTPGRYAPRRLSLHILRKYVIKRQKCEADHMKEIVSRYLYQIFSRPGTTEFGLMICFNFSLQAHLPLGTPEKLLREDFPIPVSFIYGENDWTRVVDQDFGKQIVDVNSHKGKCHFHLCPDSDHNMHMDNP